MPTNLSQHLLTKQTSPSPCPCSDIPPTAQASPMDIEAQTPVRSMQKPYLMADAQPRSNMETSDRRHRNPRDDPRSGAQRAGGEFWQRCSRSKLGPILTQPGPPSVKQSCVEGITFGLRHAGPMTTDCQPRREPGVA